MEHILERLVAFRTVTDDKQSNHEALDYIASFLADRGMHIERFDSNDCESLVATTRPGVKTPKVLLAAHLDVVPAPDESFVLRKESGRYYGRGTLDMKFALAAYLQFVDDVQDQLEDYDFGIMVTTDEEHGGMHGAAELVKEGYLPQVCIMPDGGDNWQVQLSSKGFYYLRLKAYGKPAHGSRPWLGTNAIQPIMDTLYDIRELFGESKPENSTLNIGMIHGGAAINQVADYAEASIDIRVHTEPEKQALLAKISQICQKRGVETEVILDGAATHFKLEHPLIAPFARHITDVTGVAVEGSHTLGSNDARFFAAHDVPCISVYPAGAGHHGPEEWLSEEGFHQFKEILDRYMDDVAKTAGRTATPVASPITAGNPL